jgi:hypothetical protein
MRLQWVMPRQPQRALTRSTATLLRSTRFLSAPDEDRKGQMAGIQEARQVRAAQNQSLFRDINERIEQLNEAFETVLPLSEWVCECADTNCVQHVEMSLAEYEALRAEPNRFAVIAGHEASDVERVVSRTERYIVVEKIGAGAPVAVGNDPRRGR